MIHTDGRRTVAHHPGKVVRIPVRRSAHGEQVARVIRATQDREARR